MTMARFSEPRFEASGGPSSGTSVEETGTVKWFNVEKGFGFIARDGGGKEVFVHVSALAPSGLTALNEAERVTFGSPKAGRGRKPPGYGWSSSGQPMGEKPPLGA
jgi:CspA family cold shock protein